MARGWRVLQSYHSSTGSLRSDLLTSIVILVVSVMFMLRRERGAMNESAEGMERLELITGLNILHRNRGSSVYGESTVALLSETGSCITTVTKESRETIWLKQRLGLAMQQDNVLSILMAVGKSTSRTRGQLTFCSMPLLTI